MKALRSVGRIRSTSLLLALFVVGCGASSTSTPEVTEQPVVTLTPTEDPSLANFGKIIFGTSYDHDTLTIPEPRTRFKRDYPEIAWSAQFLEEAGATTITLILARVSESGVEEVVVTLDVDIANPDFSVVANAADLASIVDNKAGTYVLRYLNDSTLLAEGEFELVK